MRWAAAAVLLALAACGDNELSDSQRKVLACVESAEDGIFAMQDRDSWDANETVVLCRKAAGTVDDDAPRSEREMRTKLKTLGESVEAISFEDDPQANAVFMQDVLFDIIDDVRKAFDLPAAD